MTDGIQRRLAAILAADVAGYSRLMGEDEAGTLTALRHLRTKLFAPAVDGHRGQIVKSMGDGWLVEFASVVDAVTCAIEVQQGLAGHESIKLRVGVHLGDITHEEEDIFGDGVNIAARLQEIAKPGGIVISDMARRSIDGKLAAGFVDLGTQNLKNIAEPITAYGWGMTAITSDATALPLPDKPSIAVLPFVNMSGDPEQEFFSDGIAEDIITALSRFHLFFVIARNTSFTYKASSIDVKQVSRELGVQYVLEGSVRKSGTRVRVTAQLVDAIADRHVWAERYDRDLNDIFAIQDEITERIAMAVAPELHAAEMERARRKTIPELGAWELVARAGWHIGKFSAENSAEAQNLLSKALELDPENAGVLAALASSYAQDGFYRWQRPPPESLSMAAEMAQRAVALDKQDEYAHTILGLVLLFYKQHDKAIRRLETAIQINPNSSPAIGWLGATLTYTHEHDQAAELLQKAIRLSPRDPWVSVYLSHLCMIEFMAKRYKRALEWAEKTIHENPDLPSGHRMLASIHGKLGNISEAHSAYEQLDRLVPGVTIATTLQSLPFAHQSDGERYAEGLRRAGMPEE